MTGVNRWHALLRSGARFSTVQFATVAFVVLVCVAIAGADVYVVLGERAKEMQDAWTEAANLARSLGQHAEDTVRTVDASISGIARRLEIDGADPNRLDQLEEIIRLRVEKTPAIAAIIVSDENGACLVTGSAKLLPGCSLNDRDYFIYHSTHKDRKPHLGKPMRDAASGEWVMPFSLRYNQPDGSFGGVVTAGIGIDYFRRFYDTFAIGNQGSILLARDDDAATLLVRRPFVEADLGRSLADTRLFRDFISKTPSGSVELRSAVDGVVRLNSYRRLDAYPIAISVAFAKTDALAHWRDSARDHLIRTAALLGIIAPLGAWLALQIRTRQRLEEANRETAAAFRLLADNSNDLIVRIGPHLERVYVSPSSRPLLGYAPEELVGRSADDIVHPADRNLWHDAFADDGAPEEGEVPLNYRVLRKDGTVIWVEDNRRRLAANEGFVVLSRDVTRRKQAEEELSAANRRLEAMALEDGLTGLANRRHFDEALQAEFARAVRNHMHLSVVMIDVDHFKGFNDRYGHPAGDRCLQRIALALRNVVGRPGDLVARYGGEEIAMILANTPLAGALAIAERARYAVRAVAIAHERNPPQIVTVSAGVASGTPGHGLESAADLVEAADRALYQAKQQGRDRVVAAGEPAPQHLSA